MKLRYPFAVILILVIGWILNVISIINLASSDAPITMLYVFKIVGIFVFPLGAILGYFA